MEKKYGIRITMPEDDTMSMAHLLGKDWESFRWFETAALRDRIYNEMSTTPRNYRIGDRASVLLEKINP
ncbi:MAG: hypothetical protein KDJ38_07680 [Gammaproteobacteria bacterium]|nr:hypothetical protein [Gammaproteobacteria bacterium]